MVLQGTPVSDGFAIGPALIYQPYRPQLVESLTDNIPLALTELQQFIAAAKAELTALQQNLAETHPQQAAIFAAHRDIAEDEMMVEEIQQLICRQSYCAAWATHQVYHKYMATIGSSSDPYLRERAADLQDVLLRLLRCAEGLPEINLSRLAAPAVVIAHDLLPSDTATLDRRQVVGIITEIGGPTSHTAIIARSYGIPAVLGVAGATAQLAPGQTIIVDGAAGSVYGQPNPEMLRAYTLKKQRHDRLRAEQQAYLNKQPITTDGLRVQILLNIGSTDEQELQHAPHSDGVGLFRTEFLYMEKDALPTEEEQFTAYRRVLEAFGDKPVVLRTLDIGGDKTVGYMQLPQEQNPFLGQRALRLCFAREDIFRTQLRAAYRASVYGNLWVMLPMVASLDDIHRAKAVMSQVMAELAQQGIPFRPDVKVGIMIEIPSIALMADRVVEQVDFASLGTNDLCQYLMAADRLNPNVAQYYQQYHPALFRLISCVSQQFQAAGKPLCICGELAGDPTATPALLGLGVNSLSMNPSAVAGIKQRVLSLSHKSTQPLVNKIWAAGDAHQVKAALTQHSSEGRG